jgi:triacylglycerol lipase
MRRQQPLGEEVVVAKVGNSDPIVLVHGFLGWGPGELLGLRYWGGPKNDIEADLRQQGYDVRVAVVGPVSSNWDRAVELYAQLTGTRADYGAAHSKKHQHLREGPTFATPLIPQWDSKHKVHLVGHSMGGTTVTMLAHLLAHGAPEELEESGTATSPLFEGGKDWVRSVTTLSTPHRGTPFADRDGQGDYLSLVKELLLGISEIAGAAEGPGIYDFKLAQWNFARHPGESLGDYFERAMASKAADSHDLADVDLSTDGTAAMNRWLRTAPDVTYFSYATKKTFPLPLSGRHVPDPRMNPLLVESAKQIGRFTRDTPGRPVITPDWWGNDGIVPTISQIAPEGHAVTSSDGPPKRGIWNHLGVRTGWDHLNIVGLNLEIPEILGLNLIDLEPPDITAFYRELAARLAALD